MKPVVVICGRPNVGKSTLFNVLAGGAQAIVHNQSGVTRDWIEGKDRKCNFTIVDTAGLADAKGADQISIESQGRSFSKIRQASVVLFLVDARAGLVPEDEYLAKKIRQAARPGSVVLVANKSEQKTYSQALTEFHKLGFARKAAVSTSHKQGIDDLREIIEELAAKDEANEETESAEDREIIKIAILGRPNVGKSTLTNQIVGSERMIVADIPGTTVDNILSFFSRKGRDLAIIDTAGVRRKAKIIDSLEKESTRRARDAAQQADIILLLVDAGVGIVHQDQLLADLVSGYGKATLLVANKGDLLEERSKRVFRRDIRKRMPYMSHAPLTLISAIDDDFRPGSLIDKALSGYDKACQRNPAAKLTSALKKLVQASEPPRRQGKRPKLLYAHQAGVNPPLIVIHGRHTELIRSPYVRYLAGQFAELFEYSGAPVQIRFKESAATPARH